MLVEAYGTKADNKTAAVIFRAAIDKGFQEDGNAMSFWQKHMC
jgi:hypothetical protein